MTHPEIDPPKNKPALIILTTTFPASPEDGTPAFVRDLADGLADSYRVWVIAPRTRHAQTDPGDINVDRFPYFIRPFEGLADGAIMPALRSAPWRWLEVPFLILGMIIRTRALAKSLGADTVLNAHWIIPGGLSAMVISKLYGNPYVVTVHGADVYTLSGSMMRRLKAAILRGASRIMPVSGSTREAVVQLIGHSSARVTQPLPMGIAPLALASEAERKTDEFLFVGRLAAKKGLDVLVRALTLSPGAKLRVIGDGPEEAAVRKIAVESGVSDRVLWLGRLGRSDVLRELARCAGLLIPSVVANDGDQDGTPVALAEGFATGTPVIASAVGGLAEHVVHGETGYLVQPGVPSELSHLLNLAMGDPDAFQALGATARRLFEESPLDIRTTINAYLELLQSPMSAS